MSQLKSRFNSHLTVATLAFRSGDYHAALRNLYCAFRDADEGRIELSQSEENNVNHVAGKIYAALGMYSEAEAAFNKAIAGDEVSVDNGAMSIWSDRMHLAQVLRASGRIVEACQIYHSCISALADDKNKVLLAKAYLGLAQCSMDRQDFALAEESVNEALRLFEDDLGRKSFWFGRALMCLSRLYYLRGDLSSSEEILRQALSIIELLTGPYHPLRKQALNRLAKLLNLEGKEGKSAEALVEAESIERYLQNHDM